MIKIIPETGKSILDIKELQNLSVSFSDFRTNTAKSERMNIRFLNDCITFFDWYIDYAESIIKERNYKERQLCDNLFRKKIKTEKQWKDYLISSLFVSKRYVEYLKSVITHNNIHRFEHTIAYLKIDLKGLIAEIEVNYKSTIDKISLTSWRRGGLRTSDIYSATRTLFYIEEFENIEDLFLSDLKPFVMFQIRQLLEIYGKNLLGYYSITDLNGQPIKKFSQIAWNFIKKETKK